MVLDNFSSGLKNAFKKIAGLGVVDKDAVDRIVLDIQRAMLMADVDVQLVSELSNSIKKKILGEKPPAGLTLKEHFIKTLYDELVKFLGAEKGEIGLKKQRILVVGLFGSGKTTTIGKLAKWFKTRGLSVGFAACDVHRPAAKDQLEQLGKQVDAKVYRDGKKAEDVAKDALKKSREDVLIFDSAGRDALDKELAKELKNLGELIKADEVLLVIPADLGQAARKQSEEFTKLVGITGIVVTKLDGTAKGGGALSAAAATGAKIKFIGVGEKAGDFEQYDPKRFVSRLVGYGDIQGLLEKAKEAGVDEDDAIKLMEGRFTLEDFIDQVKKMQGMGPLSSIASMIPGLSGAKLPKDLLDVQEGKMKKWVHIINSATKAERENPDIIRERSRVERIAKGAGVRPEDVRQMIKNYNKIKKIVKMATGGGMKRGAIGKLIKQMGVKL